MPRLSRAYMKNAEFKARQMRFDFAVVTDAVIDILVGVKKALTSWWKKERPKHPAPAIRFQQLVLELDGIAQMPLFGPVL